MLRIFHKTTYDFIKWWKVAAISTVVFIALGLVSFAVTGGLNKSIEFTGGTQVQLAFPQAADAGRIRAALEKGGLVGAELQQFGSANEYVVRAQNETLVAQQGDNGSAVADKEFGAGSFTVAGSASVSPRVGEELTRNAIIAMVLVSFATLAYLAFRFEWRFGVAAVVATLHDVLVTMAFIKLMHLEVSLTVVAAILTLLGYSMNDTIIIFDRVRENLRTSGKTVLRDVLNKSINDTLPRSIMTHATTFAAAVALLVFAGEVIRPFSWVMAFGVLVATFSSIYVAGPILLWIEQKYPRTAPAAARAGRAGEGAMRPARADSR
ncbi:MAG: protein translocase subunit SecF [Gemmatimonadaceae bacterium]|nr:protein translocase subunit SecF [Gemmatimonadaceae bacterium]